nr:M-phase phosphoprotein 9 isoform X2 [Geotrypetes seraphini]XP_033810436.1 M-phase phosphoprotein 9 isoform X2 [Geotrypetes seraphini]
MQDMHDIEKTDSEIWKECEARWLQLFRLVEKQCQDQIAAQQEQFHNQIQLIQDEIKHLVTLQSGTSPWNASTRESPKCTNNSSDQHSEDCEDKGGSTSQLSGVNEVEKQPRALVVQESFGDTTSLSSGYNTISATEPHPNLVTSGHSATKKNTGCTESTLSELDGISLFQNAPALIENRREYVPVMEGNRLVLRTDEPHDLHFSQENQEQRFDGEDDKINKNHCGKIHYKSLTSWTQKMKQSQLKKANLVEEGCTSFICENDQTEKLALDNSGYTSAFPAYNFYLRKTNDSPASVVSEDSGFTYWKLDEREIYQPLPEHFENVFSNQQFTKTASKQLISSEKRKLSSLKDIYNRKQQESRDVDDWNSSSQSYHHHPPEVLTLDPTLHRKPSQQNPDLPPSPFNAVGSQIPLTPDSLLKPLSESHSDTESFSHSSNIHSPLLDDFSTYSKGQMLHLDPWNDHRFQIQTTATNGIPVVVSESNTETLVQTDDEENSRNASPSLMAQSELPGADCDLPDYSVSLTPLEHPMTLSRIRQSLREKHARHIADLKDYYEAELHNLKHQFDIHLTASEELKKTNQTLLDRCDQLERALTDATTQMQTVENKKSLLDIQVKDWRERFNAVNNTNKILHERIEEMRMSNKEKDKIINRLKSKLRDLEAAFQQTCKLSDDKDDRIKQECKMFQNLLMEYESLGKEHERVKDTLNTTENKLLDADSEISELKRMVSKLEIQVKQVEHENITKLRQIAESHLWTSSSKTVHHPEVLQSPSKLRTADVARRKWLIPGTDCSIFTGQPLESQINVKDNRFEDAHVLNRYHSPPEKELSCESFPRKEMPDVPIMKALKELEEKKIFKSWGTQTEKEDASNKLNGRQIGFIESVYSTAEVTEKRRDQQKPKRFNSSSSQRSSSLPPSGRRTTPTATPTKREIMLTPISMKHSPKRSPKENFSPGFNQVLSKEESSVTRFDALLDDLKTSPATQGHSPRKRLQFLSLDTRDNHLSDSETAPFGMQNGSTIGGSALENQSAASTYDLYVPGSLAPYETEFCYRTKLKTLAETEKVFDELIQEKQQIEAALNRMPCPRGRLTLQARLNKEALEDRLERINRNLGSIRMTLKKFHVLRTSANL